ncbi:FAD-linked oxidase C-terminal domain-containing protein [Nocardia sp. NPDC004568]|uniref:FAD-binding oxidoreductase n=1 Tax=Nocardia sp. NPDC004568 TaxID=3154551 RepID=UPI0033AFF0AE
MTAAVDRRTDLMRALGGLAGDIVIDDPGIVAAYRRDESRFTEAGMPFAVLTPRSTDEVAACLRACHELRVPVVTRGAGSGLSGGANAVSDGVVLSLHRMNAILAIDPVERLAVAQPGVVTGELRAAVAAQGLLYPPDPGSVAFCTLGGNVATGAGGMCCVKYGVTGDFVEALEVVLADGRVLRTGTRTVKGVAGYDLTGLLVGSEGTLGVITEITVRLVPAPGPAATLVASFADLAAAGSAVAAITAAGVSCSAVEILDRTTLRAVDAHAKMGLGEAAAMLLEARRLALPALERLGDWLLDDVCVPRAEVVALIEAVERVAAETGLTIGVFGHAGDGNLHPPIIFDRGDADSVAAATAAFDAVTAAALALGGTITGEHGVGRLKATWLTRELDPVNASIQRELRRTFDPRAILNPGVVL